MAPMAEGSGLQIDLVCRAPRETIYFDADPDRILQVLTNLLSILCFGMIFYVIQNKKK